MLQHLGPQDPGEENVDLSMMPAMELFKVAESRGNGIGLQTTGDQNKYIQSDRKETSTAGGSIYHTVETVCGMSDEVQLVSPAPVRTFAEWLSMHQPANNDFGECRTETQICVYTVILRKQISCLNMTARLMFLSSVD
jgi:hypothetical protein